MSKKILHYPDPVLRVKSKSVERVTATHRQLFDTLLATLTKSEGIGLAAPQIGISERLIVIAGSINPIAEEPMCMANPTITEASEEVAVGIEGCLSIPRLEVEVTRSAHIKVEYLDYHSTPQTLRADSTLAVCIQHEIDHLNGVLIVDKIPPPKRQMVLAKWRKQNRQHK